MPDYVVTHTFLDVNDGETSKSYTGTFLDYATARASANTLLTASANLTDAHLIKETLAESTLIAGAPNAASNVFERISATVDLGNAKRANMTFPSPIAGAFTGNSLALAGAEWVAFMANFTTDWTISDGENVVDTISGKRVYVRSGKSNLPT